MKLFNKTESSVAAGNRVPNRMLGAPMRSTSMGKFGRVWMGLCIASLVAVIALPVAAQQRATDVLAKRELRAPPQVKTALAAMRQEIQQKGLKYKVGYTKAMSKPRAKLLGDVDDRRITKSFRLKVNQAADKTLAADAKAQTAFLAKNPNMVTKYPYIFGRKLVCSANYKRFDWRSRGQVSPVKEQDCGNCWAFAAVGAYESAYKKRNGMMVNASEQYINDCGTADSGADAGSCSGGLADKALQHMVRVGNAKESVVGYTGTNQACTNPATPYDAIAWGYVNPASDFPTRHQIKAALCEYGPLATRLRVVSGAFFSYAGGVYNEAVASDSDGGGHAVVIVGWDDAKGAWLIKNSWGTDWGGAEGGFGWMGYNSNRIGRHTAWIKAKSRFYVLKPSIMQPTLKPLHRDPEIMHRPPQVR